MHHLHIYPNLRTMFRRLIIATVTGILAALAVAGFHHAMLLLEWLFLSNDSGSLVNAAANLSPWRRLLTPALGGLAWLITDGLAEIYSTTSPRAYRLYGGITDRWAV